MAYNKNQPFELITVLGPTATGKTRLAVELANRLNGEIISADSRQIYRGMDIGTGKDLEDYSIDGKNILYHLIDILDPTEDYNVFRFQNDFQKVYNNIQNRKTLPILCGGTGLYLDSILLNYKKYYQISLDLLNKGGLVIIDNVLWHGEVVDKSINDKYTKNIRELNDFVSKDKRVEKVIVPFGDGMTVCRKI